MKLVRRPIDPIGAGHGSVVDVLVGQIMGRTGTRKFSPLTITAHAMRAVLLAIATVTNRAGRRWRRPFTQSAPAAVFARAKRNIDVAPVTRSRRI